MPMDVLHTLTDVGLQEGYHFVDNLCYDRAEWDEENWAELMNMVR